MDTDLREELSRRIWLFGHSPPENSPDIGVLDPRHPTRHSIWTSVSDYLQERVFDHGKFRLDPEKLLFRNAFEAAVGLKSSGSILDKRRVSLYKNLVEFQPPVVFTFGDEAYRFVSANALDKQVSTKKLRIEDLGVRFREVDERFDPQKVNIFPLLHASVARASWASIGKWFSGPDKEDNYFKYVGQRIGDILLRHGRDWPIWRNRY